MRVTIYWVTKNSGAIHRMRQKFNISEGMTVNGENTVDVAEGDMELLRECERRGFIQIRRKTKNGET